MSRLVRQMRDDLGAGLLHSSLGEHFRRIDEIAFKVIHLHGHRHFRAAEHEGLAAILRHLGERLAHRRRVEVRIARLDAVVDHRMDGLFGRALGLYRLDAGLGERTLVDARLAGAGRCEQADLLEALARTEGRRLLDHVDERNLEVRHHARQEVMRRIAAHDQEVRAGIRQAEEIHGSYYPLENTPPDPMDRRIISEVLPLGVKAVDGLITVGKGQRIGVFAGSGVGKSTLLGMFARNTKADINVIALIGERGREVREFIERDLGPEGMARSVVVVATSDKPALIRNKCAKTATAVAEYFRDQGKDVLLMMDSMTRFSQAQREIGLASGEPPVTRGYPPSVYAQMPKLLERAGTNEKGSITGLYTVLVDGDDFNEPITDTARGILDGHIVLDRKLGHKNHYPAIDILQSISRVMNSIVTKEHKALAGKLKQVLATYSEAEDLINIGAYKNGSNPDIDYAIRKNKEVNEFLCQDTEEKFAFDEEVELLKKVFDD